ncbi:MAG: ATP-NAD kinase [Pseudomonadales bacterium]|nr:ATP-NAD kinase [Pseudomonadales bacterium]
MGRIGLLANPASGKDVRRLVARASVFDNQEKRAIIRRALVGCIAAGCNEVIYHNDAHGICRQAIDETTGINAIPVDSTQMGNVLDTISAARAMQDQDCDVVITLGGDGTNRAFCIGWQDAPLLPLSTGTNNVFPNLREATIAGAAAGLIASGEVPNHVFTQQKCINIEVEDQRPDFALIDALLSSERFVGARALLKPQHFRSALLTRADPAAVGITSIGGLLHPIDEESDTGLWLDFGPGGCTVNAPIAPGLYESVNVAKFQPLALGQAVQTQGPGVLAFDGERERTLRPEQKATLTITRTGPRVVDVPSTLQWAAEHGAFKQNSI